MRSTDTARCTIKAAIRLGAVALAASVLAACSHSTAGTDKWLSFHCPDGQTVMARFDPRDEFVDVVRVRAARVLAHARERRGEAGRIVRHEA